MAAPAASDQPNKDDASPRPPSFHAAGERPTDALKLTRRASRPHLQSRPTTAISGVQSDAKVNDTSPRSFSRSVSRQPSHAQIGRIVSGAASEAGETSSVVSYAPSIDLAGPAESLLGEFSALPTTPAWKSLSAQLEIENPFDRIFDQEDLLSSRFSHEFEEIEDVKSDGSNEELLRNEWSMKLKQFFIFSSSGKPIWSRHGDDQLISGYIGVVQTIVSFYQGAKDELRAFSAGDCRFVVVSKGHLHLVAISKLGESDSQLQNQLESLYMQILSTLTLPSMERMFLNRPSTDLRRPLQGTEILLDALADGFTRGSPSTLLSALECLKLRKSHRQIINNSLLKARTPSLLYGLIVADSRLVSVVRPKKHSLHPGDLQLIFNMLFEAGSVKAGGGENWIPLCLPGFNNTGYLYIGRHNEVAIILISANKEAFFELREMRDALVSQLESNSALALIRSSMQSGRPSISTIVPNNVTSNASMVRHFLYKSRGNVQYVMPSYQPHFHSAVSRRRLMNLYGELSKSLHERTGKCKVIHWVGREASALAWETPMFELLVVAKAGTSKEILARGANRIVNWIRREEERVFIIGGAVF
ncbi:hypothetical protein ANO11243_011920 [Dothideomycetidae sp. 11243]|nr:hypothetical protein ANO11243_011920 [fungal sp. No.11243]